MFDLTFGRIAFEITPFKAITFRKITFKKIDLFGLNNQK